MIKNKRGQELLQKYLIHVIIAVLLLSVFVYFIVSVSSGKTIKKQIISKKIALLLDSAEPGTEITINDSIEIALEENILSVKIKGDENAYEYEIYNTNNIVIEKEGNATLIRVSEK